MPDLFLHNSLSNRREKFVPLNPRCPTLYVCGPTVYGPVHIGNARPPVVFDTLFRLLKSLYPNAKYARNITDIDDKIINATIGSGGQRPQADAAAKVGERISASHGAGGNIAADGDRDNGHHDGDGNDGDHDGAGDGNAADPTFSSTEELAAFWRDDFLRHMNTLATLPPDEQPRATDYIPQMIAMISRLINRGVAYENAGHVLFHVPAFADYGALSNRNRDDMVAGARVEVAPYKKDAADFVLWKPSAPNQPGWQSPWGRGRPGWHIECSAMAAACLGETIDIHGGGQDLVFPHHENEIAQSRCAHNTPFFARYWLHNGFVRMDGEKMSKSLNNVTLLRDVLARHRGESARLALLSAHYRQPMNWQPALLAESAATLNRWYRLIDGETAPADCPREVMTALCNDLNTPAAIAALHAIAQDISQAGSGQRPQADAAAKVDESAAASHGAGGDLAKYSVAQLRGQLRAGAQMLGLLNMTPAEWFHGAADNATATTAATTAAITADEIEDLIAKRAAARQNRDFAAADQIRADLDARGIILEDSAGKTEWRRK